jgi:glucose-6-phosphate isomerase
MASTPGEMGNRDKLGIVSDGTNIAGFGDWVEQLVAESTGKIGKGVLPVVLTPNSSELHSGLADLLPIHIQENASPAGGDSVSVSGSIGEQFLLWEFATAVASMLLGVNPFDQPDVESAKIAARGMLEKQADILSPDFEDEGISVNISGFDSKEQTLAAAFKALLTQIDSDEGYFSIHAYLDRNSAIKAPELRDLIANHSRRPVTFGWGPRFLHSTGQYHKGGPKQGVYLQLIAQAKDDIKVPGREFTLNQLISSQAAGDAKVLANLGRPVLTLRLSNVEADLERISKLLK